MALQLLTWLYSFWAAGYIHLSFVSESPKASTDGRDRKIGNNNPSINKGFGGISHLTEGDICLYLYLALFIVFSSTSSVRRFQNTMHLLIQWPFINIVSFHKWKWGLFLLTFNALISIQVTIPATLEIAFQKTEAVLCTLTVSTGVSLIWSLSSIVSACYLSETMELSWT